MERLTKVMKCDDGNKLYDFSNEVVRNYKDFSSRLELMFQKLVEYEDLEEQGLMLRLSCKVGDTIWYVDEDDDDYPIKLEIDTISRNDNNDIWYYAYDDVYGKFGFINSDFGKTVFLTKAEAEKKLKEKESERYDDWWNYRFGYIACFDKIVDDIAEQLKAGEENE